MKQSVKRVLDRYDKDRIPTGGFLRAVLANDLLDAIARGDTENLRDLCEIVCYISVELPVESYGSYKAVAEWLTGKKI